MSDYKHIFITRSFLAPLALVVACMFCGPATSGALGPAILSGEDGNLGYDVNIASGNLFFAQSDIQVHHGAGPNLNFARNYNSLGDGTDIGFGPNWTHTYSWYSRTATDGSYANIVTDTGRVITFAAQGSKWLPPNGEFGSLSSINGSYVYTDKFGTSYFFDTAGRLTSISQADNYPITITYSAGNQIKTVTSQNCPAALAGALGCSGVSLSFFYSGAHISSVTDPTGATWSYGYDPVYLPGLCVQTRFNVCGPQLLQQGTGLLQSVTLPNASISSEAVHGMYLYSYTEQNEVGSKFSPGPGTGYLTGYAVVNSAGPFATSTKFQSDVTEKVLGLFDYEPELPCGLKNGVICEAASGIVGNQLVRDIKFKYQNSSGNIITTASFNGGAKTFTSDYIDGTNTRLTKMSSTAGTGRPGELQSESWTWNTNLTLAGHQDARGTGTVYSTYDNLGNPTSITEGFGTQNARVTLVTWHPVLSRPLTITRESVTTPGCLATGITPCELHQVIFDYDEPYNGVYSSSWNSHPTNAVYQIIEAGFTTQNITSAYNGATQLHTVQLSRDQALRVTRVAGPNPGQLISYTYSQNTGFLESKTVTVAHNRSLTTKYGFDADGRLTKVTDPNGNSKIRTYDQVGNEISSAIVSADGKTSTGITISRDLAENLIQKIGADGAVISTEYDAALRPWRISATGARGTPLSGASTVWSETIDYDTFGRPLTQRLFSGLGTDEGVGCATLGTEDLCKDYRYDAWERVVSVGFLDSTNSPCKGSNCATTYQYDPNGNLTVISNVINQQAASTTFTYDFLNRVVTIQANGGGQSTLGYDVNDHLVWRRDPLDAQNNGGVGPSRVTYYTYDDFGHAIRVQNPDIGNWSSVYDAAGNLIASQDNSGAQLTYQYDLLNRRLGVNNVVQYNYDQTGAMQNYSHATFANTLGRLSSVMGLGASGNEIVNNFTYDYRGGIVLDVETGPQGTGWPDFTTTTYQRDPNSLTLDSITYPDGLQVKYQQPAGSGLMASGVTVPFNGSTTQLVSDVGYFSDGRISELTLGTNGNDRVAITRNKRGEITSVVSGPLGNPVINQTYTYADWTIGQLTNVQFFPGQQNSWQWNLGHNVAGQLISYSTNVRPTADQYAWSYDLVGNRTSETYNNGQLIRTYSYDPSGVTNQQTSASGSNYWSPWLGGIYQATYNMNGAVSQVIVQSDHWFGTAQNYFPYFQFLYNSHHRLQEIDSFSPPQSSFPSGDKGGGSPLPFASTTYQQNFYDGFDRISEVYCPFSASASGWDPAFGVCGQAIAQAILVGNASNSSPVLNNTWHQFYYGVKNRLFEEFDNNFKFVNGCPAYDITDHVYLADQEIARVLRQYQSVGVSPNCAPYKFVDVDILYLHHDARGFVVAAESQAKGGLAWEAEIAPGGQVMNVGIPGADGKMGTSNDIVFPDPRVITLTSGVASASADGQLGGFLDQTFEIDPTSGRSTVPGGNIWSPYGGTAFAASDVSWGPGGVGSGDMAPDSSPLGLLASLVLASGAPAIDYQVVDAGVPGPGAVADWGFADGGLADGGGVDNHKIAGIPQAKLTLGFKTVFDTGSAIGGWVSFGKLLLLAAGLSVPGADVPSAAELIVLGHAIAASGGVAAYKTIGLAQDVKAFQEMNTNNPVNQAPEALASNGLPNVSMPGFNQSFNLALSGRFDVQEDLSQVDDFGRNAANFTPTFTPSAVLNGAEALDDFSFNQADPFGLLGSDGAYNFSAANFGMTLGFAIEMEFDSYSNTWATPPTTYVNPPSVCVELPDQCSP